MVRQYRGAWGGNRSDQSGESIFAMDPFSIEILLFVEYDVYLFTARVETRKY